MKFGKTWLGVVVALSLSTPVLAANGGDGPASGTPEDKEVLGQVFDADQKPMVVAALSPVEMKGTKGASVRMSYEEMFRRTGDPGVVDLFLMDFYGPGVWERVRSLDTAMRSLEQRAGSL